MPELDLHSNATVRYQVNGEGNSTLLLFNGATLPLEFWDPVAKELSTTHRVVRFDQRDAGATRFDGSFSLNDVAADAAAILAKTGVENVIAVGHAWGGRAAQVLARDYPHLVKGLIVCGTGGQLPAKVPEATSRGMRDCARAGDQSGWEAHLEAAFCAEGFRARAPEAFRSIADLLWANKPNRQARWDARISPSSSYWGTASVPTLLIYGVEDKNGTPENAEDLHARLANSRLEMIAAAGHFVVREAPGNVSELIAGFLTQREMET